MRAYVRACVRARARARVCVSVCVCVFVKDRDTVCMHVGVLYIVLGWDLNYSLSFLPTRFNKVRQHKIQSLI